jgi:hypothetical protein
MQGLRHNYRRWRGRIASLHGEHLGVYVVTSSPLPQCRNLLEAAGKAHGASQTSISQNAGVVTHKDTNIGFSYPPVVSRILFPSTTSCLPDSPHTTWSIYHISTSRDPRLGFYGISFAQHTTTCQMTSFHPPNCLI